MVSAGHRSGYRNFLSVPSCTCMAILSILMKSRCHRFSSHIISVFIGCALWKIEIIKQTELLRYALPFQVISGGWCSDEVLVLITECTLCRRGSTEANVRRHNGFYATPPETLRTNQRIAEHGAPLSKLRFNVLFVLPTAESRSIITEFGF